MSLTICMLTYHEADNLKWILPKIKKIVENIDEDDIEYLIVDSMKPTDDSEIICHEFGAVYVNQEEPFYGGAMRTAFKYASNDLFMILDADGSQDINRIPDMYNRFCECKPDVCIGSRYVEGGQTEDSKTSQMMSHILNWFFTRVMGINVKDVSDSFRIYNTCDLKRLYLECDNFDVAEECLFKLKLIKGGKLNVEEVPIRFVKREIGESKRSLLKFIVSFGETLIQFWVLNIISRGGYMPIEDDKKARRISNSIIAGGIIVFCFIVVGIIAETLK